MNAPLLVRSLALLLVLQAACSTEASGAGEPAAQVVEHVDTAQAAELLRAEPATVVLDVRTPAEFEAGHIEGAVMVDFRQPDFGDRLAELDRGRTYLVTCRSGNRSGQAFEQMKALGFTSIYHLDGGMQAWEAAGQPVAR